MLVADPQFHLMALDVFIKSFAIEKPNAVKGIQVSFQQLH